MISDKDDKLNSVIDKVKKLLALASNNANENEVKAAASAADKLIQEYRLTAAQLETKDATLSEPFIRKVVGQGGRRRAWCETILDALCTTYGAAWYLNTQRVGGEHAPGAPGSKGQCSYIVCAKTSDALVIDYMYDYLTRQTDRLGKYHCEGFGRAYAASWRVGCAHGIAKQYDDMRLAARQEATNFAQENSAALVLLTNRKKEAETFMRSGMRLGKASSVYGAKSDLGKEHGYNAGKSININRKVLT